jgi:hypothetical protein
MAGVVRDEDLIEQDPAETRYSALFFNATGDRSGRALGGGTQFVNDDRSPDASANPRIAGADSAPDSIVGKLALSPRPAG